MLRNHHLHPSLLSIRIYYNNYLYAADNVAIFNAALKSTSS